MEWSEFIRMARPQADWSEAGSILCLDPGETTGWAHFDEAELVDCGQWDTGTDPASMADYIHERNEKSPLDVIVFEEYRIRGNRAKEHIGSEVYTIQHIGAIKVAADELWIPTVKQSAGMAKGFATDTKLRRWGLYQVNRRHANDAIRHGIYYHLFYFGRRDPRRTE